MIRLPPLLPPACLALVLSRALALSGLPSPSLLDLPATNAIPEEAPVPVTAAPDPEETNPARLALRRLAGLPASTNTTLRLPSVEGIVTLRPEEPSKGRNVDEIFEEIKVRDILKEVEEMRRASKNLEALGLIQTNLATVTGVNARFGLFNQLGVIYNFMQDHPAAAEAYTAALDLKPDSALTACNLAATHLYVNEPDKALEALGRIQINVLSPAEKQRILYFMHFNYACAHALRSKLEEGLAHLELAAKQDAARALADMSDPQLDNLRADPRFRQLEASLSGLPR